MSSELEFIVRSLAALEGGSKLPDDVARVWIRGLRAYRDKPSISMEDAFGLRGPTGKRRVWSEFAQQERARFIQIVFARTYSKIGISKRRAAELIARDLDAIQSGSTVAFPRELVELYDALARLPVKLPRSARQVEKYLSIPLKDPL